jgi:hypothetical protein
MLKHTFADNLLIAVKSSRENNEVKTYGQLAFYDKPLDSITTRSELVDKLNLLISDYGIHPADIIVINLYTGEQVKINTRITLIPDWEDPEGE